MSDDHRRDVWRRESEGRLSRRPGGERDFYGRDERGEDDYGLGYGEEGLTNYRLRSTRYSRDADMGFGPYGRSDHGYREQGRGFDRPDRLHDSGGDFIREYDRGHARSGRDYRDGDLSPYGRSEYARGRRDGRGRDYDRSFWDRASDEVSSWFGDDEAEYRRRMDARHEGRGPKGYRRSDERIREDVSDRLTDDPFIDASDIEVEVSGGEVTLSGTVDSRMARRRAEDIAERCSGIVHVQNNLRVNSGSENVREERDRAKRGIFSGA